MKILKLIGILLAAGALGGCAGLLQKPLSPQTASNTCLQARTLYTNLKANPNTAVYTTEDGENCSAIYDHRVNQEG